MGVVAVLSPRPLVVEALTITGCELRVTNTGPDDDEYRFKLVGDGEAWGFFGGLDTVAVPAGGQGTAKVLFRLPRAASPPAGPLTFGVQVASVRDPSVAIVAEGQLDVRPFSDVLASIQPRSARAAGPSEHELTVVNRGNALVRATVRGTDPDGHLDVDVDPAAVEAPPGGTATAKVRVRPRRRARRAAAERPFRLLVTPDGGEPIPVDATLTQEPVRRPPAVLVAMAVLGLLLLAGAVRALTSGGSDGGQAAGPAVTTVDTVNPSCPGQGHYNSDRAVTGALPFSFSFLQVTPDGCQPVRFNPCEPIHYVVNPANAPAGGVADVHEAFRRIAAAGGYTVVADGLTDADRFDFRRLPYQPAVYGDRWAPIVVSWSHLGNQAANDVVVAGRGQPVEVDGVLVTGMLDLNADARTDLSRQDAVPDGFGKGISWGKVMLHELGHVFGLGHVESKGQVMHEQLLEQTLPDANYGIGDLTAWRLIGRQAGCGQTPAPRDAPPLVSRLPATTAPAR